MFLSVLAVLYLSSVVMFISWPASMGMSASPGVFPVRISGPFYCPSARLRQGRKAYRVKRNGKRAAGPLTFSLPGVVDDRLMVLVMLDMSICRAWPYLVGAMGEVHADNVQSSWSCQWRQMAMNNEPPLRRSLMRSTELVLGPSRSASSHSKKKTDRWCR
jgi:hypothetical protein